MRRTAPLIVAFSLFASLGATKTETFDRDPGWDGGNNRPADRRDEPVTVRQLLVGQVEKDLVAFAVDVLVELVKVKLVGHDRRRQAPRPSGH